MSAALSGLRAGKKRTLTALAALFLLPLAVAFFTYYGTPWRPARRVNHGVLILPARSLPQLSLPRVGLEPPGAVPTPGGTPFHGRWSLVYLGSGACDAACRETLHVMRQTRLALNKDMTRVERVFLASDPCCDLAFLAREHAGLRVLDASGPAARPLLAQFPAAGREHMLFIVDPLGNLMMSYDARTNPRGLLEDLKKLLALSHVG